MRRPMSAMWTAAAPGVATGSVGISPLVPPPVSKVADIALVMFY